MKPKVIAIDVDGTLTKETSWTEEDCLNAEPRQDVIDKLNELSKTNFIVIYTARREHLYHASMSWIRKHNVQYHATNFGTKMPADVYFDLDVINDLSKL